MLDVNDFLEERGGNPEKVRESQRRRYAPESVVDEVITLARERIKSQSVVTHTAKHPANSACS